MAGKKRERFNYEAIVARVERVRRERGMMTKEACAALGLTQSQWSRKVRGLGNAFTLAEFGAIADALDAPEGWPFVEWKVGP